MSFFNWNNSAFESYIARSLSIIFIQITCHKF